MDCHSKAMRRMQEQIDEIMDNFDFDRVHKMMLAVGWRWSNTEGGWSVPTIPELREGARHLLYRTVDERVSGCGSGGFNVIAGKDFISLQWGPEYIAEIEEEE